MKYLQDYQENAQTRLFDKTGAFFAFSNKQFDEAKKDGVKYVSVGAGMICPTENVKELIETLHSIYKGAIKKDLKENGKETIIKRELYNHECFYTNDISDAVDKLEFYGFTEKEIYSVFNNERNIIKNRINFFLCESVKL